jgi:hypothetical protein
MNFAVRSERSNSAKTWSKCGREIEIEIEIEKWDVGA